MLVGRAHEIKIIEDLLAEARRATAGVIVLRGDAGIGKTAILDKIVEGVETTGEFMILAARGHEVESHISFGVLATLLDPVLDLLPELPEVQSAALAGALRLKPSAEGDRLAVGSATLGLFAAMAERKPLLVCLDDAHWSDLPSLEAIAFASRRLHAEQAAVLLAARSEVDTDPVAGKWLDSLPNLAISGLTESDAIELLERRAHLLDPDQLKQHVVQTMGNPLALLELTEQPDSLSPVTPMAIGNRLEQAFGYRLRRCTSSTRKALLLLAVCGGETDTLRHVLEGEGLSFADLEQAEVVGLVYTATGVVEFRHPLMRSAVYHTATPVERREAHRAMAVSAAKVGTPRAMEREVWHLAAAATFPDEHVAGRLEQAACAAAESRSYATAMQMYEMAGRLSTSAGDRARRLVTAAELSMHAGRTEAGLSILDRMAGEATDPRAIHIRCRIEMWGGKPVAARDRLLQTGLQVADREPVWGAVMLSHAALATTMLGELGTAADMAGRAVELTIDLPDRVIMPVLLVHAFALGACGQEQPARALLARCRPHLQVYDPLNSDQIVLIAGLAYDSLEDDAEAQVWYRRAVEAARNVGAVGLLPFQLSWLAMAQWREGASAAALSTAHEATRLAEETGWWTELPNSLVGLAFVEAALGRDNDSRAHAARAVEMASTTGVRIVEARADMALALLELGAGRPAEAARHLHFVANFAAANNFGDPLLAVWAADAVEAGVRGGRPDLAADAYAVLMAEAERSDRPTARARAARARALLAEDADTADSAIAEALEYHSQANWPFEEARTWLVHGEILRRNRRRNRARMSLERGAELFERMGATGFGQRAAAELRAVGGSSRASMPELSPKLTPQETHVALIVAGGATNAEAAAHLFLSPKTVEYHLSSVYRKLGIRSRNQLAKAVTDGRVLDTASVTSL
jgi:DNA-binding CsgD family transcriptional regulator